MKSDKNLLLWYFTSQLMNKEIVFSDVDYYNFSRACNSAIDMSEANKSFFTNKPNHKKGLYFEKFLNNSLNESKSNSYEIPIPCV